MPTNSAGRPELAKVVERQMRNWELARGQHPGTPGAARPDVAHFVAISRSVGAGGLDIAAQLGERLSWPVFDRQVLQMMAGDDAVRARLYQHLDERDATWLEATLRWVLGGTVPRDDYFARLSETILALARQGPAIFLGRAADLILPRDRGLRVRLTAPAEQRAQIVATRRDLDADAARAEVERIDRERAEFRRTHFGAQANDVAGFDLLISLARFTAADAVGVILHALRVRGMVA